MWSMQPTPAQITAARTRFENIPVINGIRFINANTNVSGRTIYLYRDDDNFLYHNLERIESFAPSLITLNEFSEVPRYASRQFLSRRLFRSVSPLELLFAAQEAVVTSIDVIAVNPTTDKVSVSFDKPVALVFYVLELISNVEGEILIAGRSESGGFDKLREVNVSKLTGTYRIVVTTGQNAYSRDFNGTTPTTVLTSYSSLNDKSIRNDYPQGVIDGRRAFAEAIYPLGDSRGFDSTSILAGGTWDTAPTRQSFVNTIANFEIIRTAKIYLDAANPFLGTNHYDNTQTSPVYYENRAVQTLNSVNNQGGVSAYHSVYGEYPLFIYDTNSTDGNYLNNLKDDYLLKIQQDQAVLSESSTIQSIFTSAATVQTTRGLPEGYSAWNSTTYTLTESTKLLNTIWGSGFLRASQRIFDEGLLEGFDWRNFTTITGLELVSTTNQYDNLKDDYKNKIQATGRIGGLKHILERSRTQYGFSYDHTNSTGLSDFDYQVYLEGLRDSSQEWVYDEGRKGGYKDLYDVAGTFGFTYNSGLNAAGLQALKNDFFTSVVSWSAIAAYQENYDLGVDTPFWTLSNYTTLRDTNITSRLVYFNTLATDLRGLRGEYKVRTFEDGVIFVYNDRMFPYATPFGFTWDGSQIVASYYADLEDEFIDALREGYTPDKPTTGQTWPLRI